MPINDNAHEARSRAAKFGAAANEPAVMMKLVATVPGVGARYVCEHGHERIVKAACESPRNILCRECAGGRA